MSKPDMTTSISDYFKPVQIVSNITAFNTDPYSTWKGAFRECAKLSSKIINRQKTKETVERLDTWCSVGKDQPYGEFAIAGALAGRNFGKECYNSIELINNFDWLENKFKELYGEIN